MKLFWFIIAIAVGWVIIGFSLFSLKTTDAVRAQEKALREQEQAEYLQRNANKVIGNIHYIKDPRTGLCFAYYLRTGVEGGGPALATVPCEAIPPHLLTTAK